MPKRLEDKLPLNESRIRAIRYSIEAGKELQKSHPEIAQDFKNGKTLSEIAEKLRLEQCHDFSTGTSSNIVRYALRGYGVEGDLIFFSILPYDGLISLNEYKSQVKSHLLNRGVYLMSSEQCKINSRKGIEKRGLKPWSEEEIFSTLDMATQPGKEYQKGTLVAVSKIAQKLNELYHNGEQVRKPNAVSLFLCEYNRKLNR